MKNTCRVVALGGGYAGAYLLKSLKSKIKEGSVHLTIIDRNNYHVFHGLVAEMLVGKVQPENIISPARTLFKGADFHNGEIEKVDFDTKEITTTRFFDGKKYTVHYDHLVVGLGSFDDVSRFHGLSENTFRLKSYWGAFELKNHIVNMFEVAEIEPDMNERARLLTFVIAGANYAGIEVATELDEYVEVLTKNYYPKISYHEVRIIVMNSGEDVLPELGELYPRLSAYAKDLLDKSRIEIQYGTLLVSATPFTACTSSNESISTRTIISCTGNRQSPLFDDWSLKRDNKGRLVTDEYIRVSADKHIWAAGDCASVPHPRGGSCPPLAIFAMTQGKHIGKNIIRTLEGKALKPYRFTGLGDACCLSRRRAVGHLYGLQVTGLLAWLTWRLFMLIYLPVNNRRVRTFFDWTFFPFLGREIVSIRSNNPVSVNELYFETDQLILKQGDDGNGMYIITEGTVEVFKDHAGQDPETILATLNAGDHFGDIAIFENSQRTANVRAKTSVKLLELKRATAMLMKESIIPSSN